MDSSWWGGDFSLGELGGGSDPVNELPEELRARVKQELAPGERLLWAAVSGKAAAESWSSLRTGLLFAAGFWIISGLLFAALFEAFGEKFRPVERYLTLGGILAGIIGLLITCATTAALFDRLQERRSRRDSLFAVTDRRAIVWRPRKGTSAVEVYQYPRGRFRDVHRVELPDGSGDVVLSRDTLSEWGNTLSFEGVADVRRVEALVRHYLIDPEAHGGRRGDDGKADGTT